MILNLYQDLTQINQESNWSQNWAQISSEIRNPNSESKSSDREFNSGNFDIKFVSKFDLDHPKVKLGQIELKSAQKYEIQIWNSKILKIYMVR